MSRMQFDVAAAYAELTSRLADLGADGVRVVGVTKAHGPWAVQAACDAGITAVGENYAQEVRDKAEVLAAVRASGVEVHFIGGLQTNKVRMVAGRVDVIQSVDRTSLIDEIARRDAGIAVMVQVHHGGETNKAGCAPAEVHDLVEHALQRGLDVLGLMAVGPTDGDRGATEAAFTATRALADRLGLPECSMGMSNDLDIAVACGTTMVRVGTALFGAR
jgi:pyridoxal phosphate enzyme (YggS family)